MNFKPNTCYQLIASAGLRFMLQRANDLDGIEVCYYNPEDSDHLDRATPQITSISFEEVILFLAGKKEMSGTSGSKLPVYEVMLPSGLVVWIREHEFSHYCENYKLEFRELP